MKQVREDMVKESDRVMRLKEEVWEAIETKTVRRKKKKPYHSKWLWPLVAGVLLAFAVGTEQGQAFVKDIASYFDKEKTVEVTVEGEKETKSVAVDINEGQGFGIYVDQAWYQKEEGENRWTALHKGKGLPDVYLSIVENPAIKTSEAIAEVKKQAYSHITHEAEVTEPVKGYMVQSEDGEGSDAPVKRVYIVENGKGGSFFLTEHFFVEAAEGHGTRMDEAISTFKVVR